MHKYSVEFRLYGKDLDPSSVSINLGLEPSMIHYAGESRSRTSKWEQAMWAFDGYSAGHHRKMWDSLEKGLTFVLKKLWPVRGKIKNYTSKHDAVSWCGHYQSSFDGGPVISAAILKSLGEFGIELFIDNYFSSEETRERKPVKKEKDRLERKRKRVRQETLKSNLSQLIFLGISVFPA